VGKTSLCRRFVSGVFSDKYHATIGVKIDKRVVNLSDNDVNLIVWDLQGEDRYNKIMPAFLKGIAGYFLVVDASKAQTAEVAVDIQQRVAQVASQIPFILVLSKCDLSFDPDIEQKIQPLALKAHSVVHTSALNDSGVSEAFTELAQLLVSPGSNQLHQKTGG